MPARRSLESAVEDSDVAIANVNECLLLGIH